MPSSLFDPSKLSKMKKLDLQRKYPKATNIYSSLPAMSSVIGNQPANLMGGQLGSNLFGTPPSNSQMPMGSAMGSGKMPQFNTFGADKFGNPKFQFPSSEPREYFGPFKKEVEDKRAGSFEELFGKDSRLDLRSQKMIYEAQSSGKITREQAEGLAGRIQDYYDTKSQQGIFSDIIGAGGSDNSQSNQPEKQQRSRARKDRGPVFLPYDRNLYGEGGSVKNTYV